MLKKNPKKHFWVGVDKNGDVVPNTMEWTKIGAEGWICLYLSVVAVVKVTVTKGWR